MRLLHICGPEPGGGATVAAESVHALVGGDLWRIPSANTYRQAVCTIGGYCDPRARWLMRDVYRIYRPDVVHLHDFKRIGTAAIAAAVDLGIPAVWSCYDYWPMCPTDTGFNCCGLDGSCGPNTWTPAKGRDWPYLAKLPLHGRARRMRQWFGLLDAIICLSKDSEMRLRRFRMVGSSDYRYNSHVIPLPIRVPDLRAEKDPDYVLFLGGNHPVKGGDVFSQAAEIVKRERPRTRLVALAAQSREHALWELAKASVLVVPEQWPNPGPVVIWEANILGTRTVASRIGGIPEMGPTATFRPGDSAECAAHILDQLTVRFEPARFGPAVPIRERLMEVYRCASR